jgi:hypothetical protein
MTSLGKAIGEPELLAFGFVVFWENLSFMMDKENRNA